MSKTKKILLLIAAALVIIGLTLCLISLASLDWNWQELVKNVDHHSQVEGGVREAQSYSCEAAGIQRLEIFAVSDDISISRHEGEQIKVEYYGNGFRGYHVDAEGRTLSISYYNVQSIALPDDHNELRILLPDSFFDAGEIEAENISGDIELNDIGGKTLNAYTTSGDVELLNADFGGIDIGSVSGELELELAGSPDDYSLSVETVSGKTEGRISDMGGPRPVELATVSGDISVSFR